MKINRTNRSTEVGQDDHGFTLIEILIAIVLIGILSAVAVVGISNLVGKGGKSACNATRDSAIAASAVYFASNNNTYPVDFFQLAPGTASAAMTMPSGVESSVLTPIVWHAAPLVSGDVQVRSGSAWTLIMTKGATTADVPTFSVCT